MICVRGQRRWLGSFVKEDDAARVYDAAAVAEHGEFARLNLLPAEQPVALTGGC